MAAEQSIFNFFFHDMEPDVNRRANNNGPKIGRIDSRWWQIDPQATFEDESDQRSRYNWPHRNRWTALVEMYKLRGFTETAAMSAASGQTYYYKPASSFPTARYSLANFLNFRDEPSGLTNMTDLARQFAARFEALRKAFIGVLNRVNPGQAGISGPRARYFARYTEKYSPKFMRRAIDFVQSVRFEPAPTPAPTPAYYISRDVPTAFARMGRSRTRATQAPAATRTGGRTRAPATTQSGAPATTQSRAPAAAPAATRTGRSRTPASRAAGAAAVARAAAALNRPPPKHFRVRPQDRLVSTRINPV